MAAYVQRLPIGGRIRATLLDGSRVRGTLMKATDTAIVVQPRTRLPEPPVEVPVSKIAAIELETPSNVGRSIAIGVVAGVAGALGVIAILAAALGDD